MNIPRKKRSPASDAQAIPAAQAQRYRPAPNRGLSAQQVTQRLAQGLVNVVHDDTSQTAGQIVRSNVFTYFNLIFFLLALVLLYEGSFNNLTFLVVVTVNAVIGIIQELKSKRTLDKLKLVSAPESTVIRDGAESKIPSDQLVLDDIVVFSAGNQICADAVVCAGEVTVNESLVTGESDEIRKRPGDTLLSGSFVVSGSARARLDKVGDDAFAAKLARDAKKIKKKQQPGMMRSLTRLIQIIGMIIIPFAVAMFWNQYHVQGLAEKVSVENTAAAVIGMIPEGLYLLTSVALAASTIRLAQKDTLVHDMKCIETLARVDMLCVDKTGTITEPNMRLSQIIPLDEDDPDQTDAQVRRFVQNMSADNDTMKALKAHWQGQPTDAAAKRILGFSSRTKYSAVELEDGQTFLLGAPEMLLGEDTQPLRSRIAQLSAQGERVLLFALYEFEPDSPEDIFQGGTLGQVVVPLALVTLTNPIRPQAAQTFTYFREQGVAIKVISGDNHLTAAAAAEKAGIPGTDRCIDLSTLHSEQEVEQAALAYTVFGRVTPEQKRILVRALKKAGHTVAMTGDGVNDVLALKDADCSIAMASGSDAAAHVSDLVLLNSDFSGMPHVVAEGRRVINNIERSASLFLVKNIFSFVLSVISLVSLSLYPLKPSQISLVSGLMIGVPSFFLAMEPNHDLVHGKFLRNVLFRACPAALTAVILVVWSLLFAEAFHLPTEMASTMGFLLYAFSAYLMLYRVCKPMTPWHWTLFLSMGVAFVGAAVLLPGWFQISALSYQCVLILSPLMLLTLPIDHALHRLFDVLAQWKQRLAAAIRRKLPAKYRLDP